VASLMWNSKLDPTVDLINIHFNKIDECIKMISDEIADHLGSCDKTCESINQLKQLCQLQFMYKERLLEGLKVPFIDEQKKLHLSFLETVELFKRGSNQCHSPSFIKDLIKIRMDMVTNMNNETIKLCDFIIDRYS
jgi:hypothetical protein